MFRTKKEDADGGRSPEFSPGSRPVQDEEGHKSSSDNLNNETHNFPGNRASLLQQEDTSGLKRRVRGKATDPASATARRPTTLADELAGLQNSQLSSTQRASPSRTNDLFKKEKFEVSLSSITKNKGNASALSST